MCWQLDSRTITTTTSSTTCQNFDVASQKIAIIVCLNLWSLVKWIVIRVVKWQMFLLCYVECKLNLILASLKLRVRQHWPFKRSMRRWRLYKVWYSWNADTDTDILARILADTSDTCDLLKLFLRQAERRHATILARMSVSASWNASLYRRMQSGTAVDQTPSTQTADVVRWRSTNRCPGRHTYSATSPCDVIVHVSVAPETARGAGHGALKTNVIRTPVTAAPTVEVRK